MLKVFNWLFNQQAQWVKNYQDEVERLQADVQNIEDISNSLPDGCWKRVQLEP
jgi:coxsackievirus/adenovirus receptor